MALAEQGAEVPVLAPRRVVRLVAWMLAGFLAAFAAALALPEPAYLRYQSLDGTIHHGVRWSYERIHFDPAAIDIAFVGNSRVQAGVNAPALAAALEARLGRPVGVANLSTPQEGRNMHYLLVRELLETRPETRLVILSLVEQMPRDSHPAFRHLAPAAEVLGAPVLFNRDYPADLAYLPFRKLRLFAASLAPGLLGFDTAFDPARYEGPARDTTRDEVLPDGRVVDRGRVLPELVLRADAQARIDSIVPPLLPAGLAGYEFAIETGYTDRIARLAAAHGVALGFLVLPIFGNEGPVQAQARYEAAGFVLDAAHLAGRADWYSDYGHLNRAGSRALVPWLAERLAERIRAGAPALAPRPEPAR